MAHMDFMDIEHFSHKITFVQYNVFTLHSTEAVKTKETVFAANFGSEAY